MADLRKAYAYIVRPGIGGPELLVFAHHDYAEAGIQVPGGTLEAGEPADLAVLREVAEEAGLMSCRVVRLLARDTVTVSGRRFDRAFFHVAASATPERWQHAVTGKGEDEGMRFDYFWLPRDEWGQMHPYFSAHLPLLAGDDLSA
jgi:putative (di)nucleoside polyphosphate hydrolase